MPEALRVILLCFGLLISPIGAAIEPAPRTDPASAACCCGNSSQSCSCGCVHAVSSRDNGSTAGWTALLCGCENAPAPLPAVSGGGDTLRITLALPVLNATITSLNPSSLSTPATPADTVAGADALAFLQTVVLTV